MIFGQKSQSLQGNALYRPEHDPAPHTAAPPPPQPRLLLSPASSSAPPPQSYSLSVDDLGQAVPPHAALREGAGLLDALLPGHQSPHRQAGLELQGRDPQQPAGPLQGLCRPPGGDTLTTTLRSGGEGHLVCTPRAHAISCSCARMLLIY